MKPASSVRSPQSRSHVDRTERHRAAADDEAGPVAQDQVAIAPEARREAVLGTIRSATRSLRLSLFRCNDAAVLKELAIAVSRGVQVEVLMTRRAKGGRRRRKSLAAYFRAVGADVWRYADAKVKYHAKYLIADDRIALVGSLNPTRKCFKRTCDFLYITADPVLVADLTRLFHHDCRLPGSRFTPKSDRLIVGPEEARGRLGELILGARFRLRVIDHKLADTGMLTTLEARESSGVTVDLLGKGDTQPFTSHGRLLVVDDDLAVIGSMSLTPLSLDFRREIGVVIDDRASVDRLAEFFDSFIMR